MSIPQIAVLAIIQGLAELLPVSSSAHVIVAQKLLGLDPGAPEMTFLLVMLHTGTMFAVIAYFWSRWRGLLNFSFIRAVAVATMVTGVIGLGLKVIIEKVILEHVMGMPKGEVEHLFRVMPMIAFALAAAGVLIIWTGRRESAEQTNKAGSGGDSSGLGSLSTRASAWVGGVQGLCLPFRGFSRSGATISTAMLFGIPRRLSEEFSFALAVVLTPPVILLELRRLLKHTEGEVHLSTLLAPGCIGMVFSFLAGLVALRWLSSWLEHGRWRFFGYYCMGAAAVVLAMAVQS